MKKTFIAVFMLIFILPDISAQEHDSGNKHSHNIALAIPDIAVIDIAGPNEDGTTLNLTPDISNLEAGEAIDFSSASNNNLWLNYTSIIEKSNSGNNKGKTRKIKVELDNNLPNGINLYLEVGPANTGNGQTGSPEQGKIVLKKGPTTVVENIGSCFTENGEGKGHPLTYSIGIDEQKTDEVMAETFSVQGLYTITEN